MMVMVVIKERHDGDERQQLTTMMTSPMMTMALTMTMVMMTMRTMTMAMMMMMMMMIIIIIMKWLERKENK